MQIAAVKGELGTVLDCLFVDAWHSGAAAIEGRLEPALYEPLSRRRCVLRCTRALFHSATQSSRPRARSAGPH